MAVNLVKGENRKLDLNKFRVGLGWDVNEDASQFDFDLDVAAFMIVSENSSGVQMSNFMEIIHDFKTSKNNTILLFVYITYFINFATKLYMLIYE